MVNIHGMAGRSALAEQSKLDPSLVLLQVAGADGALIGSIVLTPKGAGDLSAQLAAARVKALDVAVPALVWPVLDNAGVTA